ncbi:hypothetical protein EV127DRAFT_411341 [Xylaria flabelliformis]|nr:hypothetical protein EV127DRAFT_411341 [Xylaria flabelliformis]
MAYLSRAAQVTLLVGAIASALILSLVCLYLYSRDRREDLESRERQKEPEKHPSEQLWETVSADASTLSFLWDPPPPTRNVRRSQGYVVSEAPVVMEPRSVRVEFA